jgi:hypothetical protein
VRGAPLSICLALFACATHRESAVQVDTAAQQEEESHAAESVEIHRIEEPSRTTTTVEEYAPPESSAGGPAGGASPADAEASAHPIHGFTGDHGLPLEPRAVVPVVLPFHGPLIKLTTITEERGQISETTSANASQASQGAAREALSGKADTERDSKPSLGLPVLALVLAGIAASAILTRGIWLGPAFNLVKRLFGGVS